MKVNIIYMFYFRYMYLDFIVLRSILKNPKFKINKIKTQSKAH